jgi:LacI family transcriptional regulator
VTIRDVAERAAVSPATVSLVLNDVAARIPEATAARVRAAATDLGYAPNSLARGLRLRRTHTIGFISDTITTTPFAVHMVEAAQHVARRHGFLLFLVNTGDDAAVERAAVRALRQQQVDGFLYACMYHRVVEPPDLGGGPVVLLNARAGTGDHPAVVPDDRGGARSAVLELIDHGHRRIGFINDVATHPAATLRLAGYRDALKERGIRYDRRLVEHSEAEPEQGAAAALRLYDRAAPTGVFCFNDRMAVGVRRGLAARGLSVPRDVSLIGFDDQEFVASYAEPPLTTVALPHYAMGQWAAQALVDRIIDGRSQDGGPGGPVHLMPCELVRRDSVAPARGDA